MLNSDWVDHIINVPLYNVVPLIFKVIMDVINSWLFFKSTDLLYMGFLRFPAVRCNINSMHKLFWTTQAIAERYFKIKMQHYVLPWGTLSCYLKWWLVVWVSEKSWDTGKKCRLLFMRRCLRSRRSVHLQPILSI